MNGVIKTTNYVSCINVPGFINSILSWDGFLPLSRLTYCAFLVHVTLMTYEFGAPDSTQLYTVTNLIYRFFGMYVMSYAVAFLLAVGVEAPMLGLEKVMLSR
ncbi:nose resistant to fluoxetine protein 6-like [Elysia marginata]|uniref:Nose resistant to fluoxetine protein 6-like n=1 Tax=Elysia marginata TaxID=1093978 RepID=A0AAV4EGS1_9GAST|nr:nose resistant to fluoxetine protein 6-like [Elysia marginata]